MKRLVVAAVLSFPIAFAAGRSAAQNVPSVYSPGCAGLLCQSGDPRVQQPPPPCQGLICGMTPYSMQVPVTAAEAQRIQAKQARQAEPAEVAQVAAHKDVKRTRTQRRAKAKPTPRRPAAKTAPKIVLPAEPAAK
jgi:hypothetical protein